MSAYMIAQIEITDPEEYQTYLAGFMPIFQRHGGELCVGESSPTNGSLLGFACCTVRLPVVHSVLYRGF